MKMSWIFARDYPGGRLKISRNQCANNFPRPFMNRAPSAPIAMNAWRRTPFKRLDGSSEGWEECDRQVPIPLPERRRTKSD
jgi:hypothetical protein